MNSVEHFFPVRRQKMLSRARIVSLALAGSPALIILKGGGGSGKSIAASQIAAQFIHSHTSESPNRPVSAVWIRHAPTESTVSSFWARILSSLDQAKLLPDASIAKDLVLGGLSSATPDIIRSAFSELQTPYLLVIDDAHHVLTTQIETSIIHTLANTRNLTIVITTRRSPISLTSTRSRIDVPINVLNSEDLAFSPDDTSDLIRLRFPTSSVSEGDELARQIHRRTKGWSLATDAIVIEGGSEHTTTNTWRPGSFVREYVDQLLAVDDADTRMALCASSLVEETSIELLADMLERPAEQIEHLVASSFEDSLGYWADESDIRWYRHHDLIRTELKERAYALIEPSALQNMYSRAAHFLQKVRPRYAREAAIQAGEWKLLTDLLIRDMEFSFRRQRTSAWMEKVPSKVREEYPVIAAFALLNEYAFPSGRYRQMIAGFKLLASRTLARESELDGIIGITAATLRMVAARLSGLNDLAVKMSRRVLQLLEASTDDDIAHLEHVLEVGWTQLGITLIHTGQFSEADSILATFLARPQSLLARNLVHGTALLAWSHAWQGDMHQTTATIREAQSMPLPVGWKESYVGAGYRIARALSALEIDRVDEAQEEIEALSEHASTIEHWPFLTYVSTLIAESRFGPAEALSVLEQQLQKRQGRASPLTATSRIIQILQMRLAWQSGQILAKDTEPDAGAVYGALSRGENDVAFGIALSTSRQASYAGNHRGRAELLLLQAESARRLGNSEAAAEAAKVGSLLLSTHGLTLPMRAIPRDAATQLALLVPSLPVDSSSRGSTRQVQPLTPAELSALQMVIENGSVPAAAKALFLSPETVKGYMKQVYRKLDVRSRAEAIQVASEARLFATPKQQSSEGLL